MNYLTMPSGNSEKFRGSTLYTIPSTISNISFEMAYFDCEQPNMSVWFWFQIVNPAQDPGVKPLFDMLHYARSVICAHKRDMVYAFCNPRQVEHQKVALMLQILGFENVTDFENLDFTRKSLEGMEVYRLKRVVFEAEERSRQEAREILAKKASVKPS